MQIVGGLLALLMMAELNDNGVTYSESMGGEAMADWAFDGMTMAGGIAAGAVLWCIHSRTDNPWATAVGVIAMGSYIGASGSTDMASMLANEMGDLVPTLLDYVVTGVSVGLGALLATKIDEAMA
jgi:hypothetical protein